MTIRSDAVARISEEVFVTSPGTAAVTLGSADVIELLGALDDLPTAAVTPAPGVADAVRAESFARQECAWCDRPAVGTARDEDGTVLLTCGQEGHGAA